MIDSRWTEQVCTMADAIMIIKKARKTTFRVRGQSDLPVYENGEPTGKCFPGSALIKVSAKDAIKYVTDMLGTSFGERGGRIEIRVCLADNITSKYSKHFMVIG